MSEQPRSDGRDGWGGFVLGALPPLDGRPGPARALSDRKQRALINRALDTVLVMRAAPAVRPRLWRLALAAGFVFCLGSGATAGVLIYRQLEEPPAPVVQVETPQPRPARRAARRPVAPPAEPAPGVAPVAEPEPPRRARPARTSLEGLLQSAADLRGSQRWREATDVYERVMQAAPRSDLGHTAAINAAFLRLEHLGDARGARRLFEGVLGAGPRSGLAEEARWGRAQSLRALGDRRAERQALAEFLRAHPESIRWARADARYRELALVP